MTTDSLRPEEEGNIRREGLKWYFRDKLTMVLSERDTSFEDTVTKQNVYSTAKTIPLIPNKCLYTFPLRNHSIAKAELILTSLPVIRK